MTQSMQSFKMTPTDPQKEICYLKVKNIEIDCGKEYREKNLFLRVTASIS